MPKNLEATIDISASPEKVWAVVSDLKRMPEFSPQCVKMKALGTPKAGTWTINLNKQGMKYWPTTSRIVRYDANEEFSFRMNENHTVWSFTLEPTATGTRLIQRRDAAAGVPWLIRKATDVALGGEESFEQELVQGMNETLGKIKTVVEG